MFSRGGGNLTEDTWVNCLANAKSEYVIVVKAYIDNRNLNFVVSVPKSTFADGYIYGNGYYVSSNFYGLSAVLTSNGTNAFYILKNGVTESVTPTITYYYR